MLVTHYARPEYLASLQILLNLEHDPRTSEEVRETMRGASERSQENINRLLREALGPETPPDVAATMFLVVRGFGFSQQLTESIAIRRPPQAPAGAPGTLSGCCWPRCWRPYFPEQDG